MKRILTVFALLIITQSCSLRIKEVPLIGTYPEPPFIALSDKSFEDVWSNLIDLFAQNGLGITLIDKSSGLIIASKTRLSWTFEDKEGKPLKADADVVLSKKIDPGPMRPYKPSYCAGDWNVRIKVLPNGKTSINVNLLNIDAYILHGNAGEKLYLKAKSTGRLEKIISEKINQ